MDAVNEGQCVAFVGAGFSAAAGLPRWTDLLRRVAVSPGLERRTRQYVLTRVKDGSAHALDEAAQVLEDALGRDEFLSVLKRQLASPRLNARMRERLRYLRGIPFRAILTVNFDPILSGPTPSSDAYRSVLRPQQYRWWEASLFWKGASLGPTLVKLHGDIEDAGSIVFTRRDYRRRLYGDPAYMSFLRAVLAQQTVLFMGFSFADAYLNELRSEVLALLGQESESVPIAYAVLNDAGNAARDNLRRTEGVDVISYRSEKPPDHQGFDEILQELHERTNPTLRLGRMLAGKRILWVIRPNYPDEILKGVFRRLARSCRIVKADGADSGIAALERGRKRGAAFDLVITHWGKSARGGPTAVQLLQQMRRRDLRAPVVVFAKALDMNRRKRLALSLGAHGYFNTYAAMLRAVERIFAPGMETA